MKNKILLLFLLSTSLLLVGCAVPVTNFQGNNLTMSHKDGSCADVGLLTIFAKGSCNRSLNMPYAVLRTVNAGSCTNGRVISATFECTGLSGSGSAGSSGEDINRLELRAMQTRKFLKSPTVVVKAITELNKDKGSKCVGLSVPKYSCQGTMQDVTVGDKVVKKCMAPDGVSSGIIKMQSSSGECTSSTGMNASYEIDSNYPANTQTIVRIRLSSSSNPQIADPAAYSRIFKQIADGLFIDAIQLTPAEMQ
ncbi:hypothetical protein [Polynucleobacter sp. AP-Kaivos-20-H2]|jgi:hypothetical protein|uniref:hypothetical protein n=1 Tax=Polynucleobacter sp. AP-Kaivos-20-H2 TaxID=2689104 RepID=UPI001C0C6E24|nr:hypothetical protein [Polynucleobacter sp. AP-Kaivos-20-H2]MBU3603470.1 hypothetical protein [Polynucleobacter sp. AP-Kaivos-20-H2]